MSEGSARNEEAIFDAAIQINDHAERKDYVKRACGGDPQLLTAIQSLLGHHDSHVFLDNLFVDPDLKLSEFPLTEGPGTLIGRYTLLEKVGEGGMAVVYMAVQEKPIRRKVALKIIKLGMDTRQVIARFEAERQALAIMDHPNIAKVFDAGATETGRPYFVMELVEGVSITEYCDQKNLSTRERLDLFVQVCTAIQHAHHKGIIHRDIKPSNVMVDSQDGAPMPKIIDFGVAKAVNQRLTEKTLLTRHAQIIGTPAYMSPEQAELSDFDVDTRTDVYSLGVLLYELLTGTTPFGEEYLHRAGYLEMQRVIREEEPTKPSTKLANLGQTLMEVARCRSAHPETLARSVRGDLDWIVMKALEKQRTRRYETPSGLAADIQRHLRHEPIEARAPGAMYRLRKFLCRRRAEVGVTLLAILALAATVGILSMWHEDRIRLAEVEAIQDRSLLSQASELHVKGQQEEALKELQAILHSAYVGSEAQLLYAGILVEEGRQPDKAETMLRELLNERPEIAGAAHSWLARILWENPSANTTRSQEIQEHQRRAQELLPETAEACFQGAMAVATIREKLQFLDDALYLDPGHYESRRLRAYIYWASRRYDWMRDDALAMIVKRPLDPLGYFLRAIAWHHLGRFQAAVTAYDRALEHTPMHAPEYAEVNNWRCEALMRMGQYELALTGALKALEHAPNATVLQSRVLCARTALGQYDKANALMQRLVASQTNSDDEVRLESMNYVFETLAAGQQWHPPDNVPEGPTFFYMFEAEEMYHGLLRIGARPLITNGFSPSWSPDGTKVAYAQGLPGYSGIAVYDIDSNETTLLTVGGKNPRWSPDGRHIAFVRDAPALRLSDLAKSLSRSRTGSYIRGEEVWVIKADGSEPRRLATQAHCPSWNADGKQVYYRAHYGDLVVYAISIEDLEAQPVPICDQTSAFPTVSSQGNYIANLDGGAERCAVLRIVDVNNQSCIDEWVTPLESPTATWSPDECELSLGSFNGIRARTGLWIYDFVKGQGIKVLSGHFGGACWSLDRTRLLIPAGKPCWQVWVADLDPNLSTAESLGAAQTMEEHCLDSIEICTQDLEVEPDSYVDRWMRVTSALWIDHPQSQIFLDEMDAHLGQPPCRPSERNSQAALGILAHPELRERLGGLAWVLARRAVEQQPQHAEELVGAFERVEWYEHAAQLQQIAQARALKGSYRYGKKSSSYAVVGAGIGIGGQVDGFHFVHNILEGDGSITARIDSIKEMPPSGKAGIMIRASLDPGAAFVALLATPDDGVTLQIRPLVDRDVTVDDRWATPHQTVPHPPVWIRIERKGDQFSALCSSDGTLWTPMIQGAQEVILPRRVYIGLAATSSDSTKTAEARFSRVEIAGDVELFGPMRYSQDIGLGPDRPLPSKKTHAAEADTDKTKPDTEDDP